MGHRPKIDRLAGSPDHAFQILFDKSELALRLERQGLSVELIPLPDLVRSGHGNHKIDRLFAIGPGFLEVPSQGVNATT